MIVKKAPYGLPSFGVAFRSKLANALFTNQYCASESEPKVRIRPATKECGSQYYEMCLCYVDDVLVVISNPETTIDCIREVFILKNDKSFVPEMYLGAEMKKVKTTSRHECWCISSPTYIKYAILINEEKLQKKNEELPQYCSNPLSYNYPPENDITPELDEEDTTFYQEAIGRIHWAVEIGRLDILFEVSIMSS